VSLNLCRECQRLRRHIEILRDRNGELELRLEGARQRERRAAALSAKGPDRPKQSTPWPVTAPIFAAVEQRVSNQEDQC
jgi:hypothetical protein